MSSDSGPTAAAIAARRRQTQQKLEQVATAISRLHRERGRPSVRAMHSGPGFLTTENTNLKHRVQQLTREYRTLQERLEGARSNLRFSDRRIADLEAQVLENRSAPPPV